MSDRKRPPPYDHQDYDHRPHKRHNLDSGSHYKPSYDDRKSNHQRAYNDRDAHHKSSNTQQAKSHKKQHDSSAKAPLPTELPPLPSVTAEYSTAPFTHRSVTSESRSVNDAKALSYERLEFLGDAYLELFASRLIYTRFAHLPTGQMSQLRELLVKNDTLAEYSRAYAFDKRILVADLVQMQADSRKSNKGYNKVLGDVFEAYISAVILSHGDKGFAIAEKWVCALWEPLLRDAIEQDKNYDPGFAAAPEDGSRDPSKQYDPDAKAKLQKRIIGGADKKLAYEPYRASVELKGSQLGQNRHYIAVYLTGYGYDRKELGRGEGKNKVEAGNWAAIEAMYGDSKDIVDACEKTGKVDKEKRKSEMHAAERRTKDVGEEDTIVAKME